VNCPGDAYDQDVALNAGNNWINLTGNIPTGLECTITEPTVPAGWQLESIVPDSVTVTEGTPEAVQVVVTNTRLMGGLTITKNTVGGAGTFTFEVDCSDDDFDFKGEKAIVLEVGADDTESVLIEDIPTGTECTVTEQANGLFSTVVVPADGTVTIDTDGEDVEFTNTRLFGRTTVTKNLVGAPNGASTSFTFSVNCDPGTEFDQMLTINVGSGTSASATTGLIPTGTSCTVTEASAPDWNQTSVVPAGGVVTVPGTVTFTNTRKAGVLNVSKAVSPVAGNGVVVEFGDTLTYTLTVSATGEATQHDVFVTDFIPGYDPARPSSGKTTYVAGSATCIGAGTCTVTQPGADQKITWFLDDMAPGTTRQVTFKVTIDDVAGDPGETVAVDVLNAGAVKSNETPLKPSNQVITPVTKVLPVKQSKPPAVLPHTGALVQPGPLAAGAVLLLGLGLLLMAAGRRGPAGGSHRR
jgi:uncharacterized repeat protein (TIGR01451 family)